ncbi:MAG: ABC transporter ATP-binding protein/permease, partial [Sandaracinaceae bacterium]|nr:ABC transporter ATP-binding protein/permease [Sandaracinaceae bacterium]
PRALAVLAAITLAARPIARLVGTVSEAGTVLPSLRRVEELLARRAAPEPPAEVTRAPWRTIVVSELTVRRGERCVLDRLGLELRAGERVGITGENGTGKTTLLLALLDLVPHEGTTSIDGRPGSLASRCAWVPQDPALVEGTVLSNVTVGREPDRERALDALQQAGAAEWLAKRGGLEASIEVAGTNLSRGEKQRLCLARALYRDAPILVLDEPTASLDTAGVEAFVSLLGALVRDRTTVMVTHDERLLAACTRVLVLERGVLRPRARSLVDDGQPHT